MTFEEWKRKSLPNTKAKDAWNSQQEVIDDLNKKISNLLEFIDSDQLGYDARLGDFYRDIVDILK